MTELFIAGVLAPAGLVGDRMRVMKGQLWQNYEEVANFLLDKVAAELGLERVEGDSGAALTAHDDLVQILTAKADAVER